MSHDLTTREGIAAAIKSAKGLAALMAVCDAASPGPWEVNGGAYLPIVATVHGKRRQIGRLESMGDHLTCSEVEANGDFVFVARTALPLALAELARVQAIVDRLPKTADGGPITLGINLWVKGMLLSEGVGVLAITDPDTSHPDDYPPGERWLITVCDGQGDEMTVWNGKCYSSQTAADAAGGDA